MRLDFEDRSSSPGRALHRSTRKLQQSDVDVSGWKKVQKAQRNTEEARRFGAKPAGVELQPVLLGRMGGRLGEAAGAAFCLHLDGRRQLLVPDGIQLGPGGLPRAGDL